MGRAAEAADDQGHHPPRYCRFFTSLITLSYFALLPPSSPSVQPCYPCAKKHFCISACFSSSKMFHICVCSLDPVCKDTYNPKDVDDCINHWCYKTFRGAHKATEHPLFFFFAYCITLIASCLLVRYCICVEKQSLS